MAWTLTMLTMQTHGRTHGRTCSGHLDQDGTCLTYRDGRNKSGHDTVLDRAVAAKPTPLLPRHHVLPAQERRAQEHDEPIGQLAENRERHDGGDDLGRLSEMLAVDQQKADPAP